MLAARLRIFWAKPKRGVHFRILGGGKPVTVRTNSRTAAAAAAGMCVAAAATICMTVAGWSCATDQRGTAQRER